MKVRIDSDLAQLTPDQLEEIYDQIADNGFQEAVRFAALPPPEGFGLKLHRTTLARFFHRERARRHSRALLESRAAESTGDATDPNDLLTQAKNELAHATYELSIGPLHGPHYNNLSRAFYRLELLAHKDRDRELEQKRLELDTRKWEYDAIAAAVKHANELQALSADETMDDIQKFELARKGLFGHAVDGIPIRRSQVGLDVPGEPLPSPKAGSDVAASTASAGPVPTQPIQPENPTPENLHPVT